MQVLCGLVHSAFSKLFCVTSCQGAEEYTGTEGPVSSNTISLRESGFWKQCVPALAWLSVIPWVSFFHQDNLVHSLFACYQAVMFLIVNLSGRVGTEAPFGSTRELSISKVRGGFSDGKPILGRM